MSTPPIDYDALAQQHGGSSSSVDYDQLAKQHGGAPKAPSADDIDSVPGAVPGMQSPSEVGGKKPEIPVEEINAAQAVTHTTPINPSGIPEDQYRRVHPPTLNNYGQKAIPQIAKGVKEIRAGAPAAWSFKPQDTKQLETGASDVLEGVGEGMSGSVLPMGENPLALAKGMAIGNVGSTVAPEVAKAMGASPETQRLAGDVAGVLPMAAGVSENKPIVPQEEAGALGRTAAGANNLPGENYTPEQHKSLAGILARGQTNDKGFIPQDVAHAIGSTLKQAAADHPEITKAIHEGTPEDSLGAFQGLMGKAKQHIDYLHQEALKPVKDTPFDPTPVINSVSFPRSLTGFSPEDAAAVRDLRSRLSTVNTLEGANELRMYLNNEMSPDIRANSIAAGRSGSVDTAYGDALKALRNSYYDQLQNATGVDYSGLKRTEGGIMSAQEAIENASPSLTKREALANEPKTFRGNIADAIQGGRSLHGGPISGVANVVAEKLLKQTPLAPVQENLQRFFTNLPEPSAYKGPLSSPWNPAPKKLPANVPGNAPFGAQPDTGSIPPKGTPSILTPEPDKQLQLPASTANSEFQMPPAPPAGTPPPPVNRDTARMQVHTNPPQVSHSGTINVNPEGTATVQRPQLPAPAPTPAPETHSFSKSQWRLSNPGGNLMDAIKQARSRGYKVID